MAPNLTEDEIDDLIYFARADELKDLQETLTTLAAREEATQAEILTAARDQSKSSCLHMAAGNGNLDIVTALLAQFATAPDAMRKTYLDLPNEFGNTGLHWACLRGHLEVVKALLAAGASPAVANDKDQIPLDLALFGEKQDVVDHFMSLSGGLEGKNEGDDAEAGLSASVAAVEVDGEVEDDEELSGKGTGEGGTSSKKEASS